MTFPECLGYINEHYFIGCSECDYAAICAATALKFRNDHSDMFPIGGNDDKSEAEDTKDA